MVQQTTQPTLALVDAQAPWCTGSPVNLVSFSPTGELVAWAGRDASIQVRDAATGALLATYRRHQGLVHGLSWSPDGSRIASASADGTARIWTALPLPPTGTQLEEALTVYRGHATPVSAIAYFPDGRRIASGDEDGHLQVWEQATGTLLATCRGHDDWVNVIACAPDGAHIVSASADRTVRVWEADSGRELSRYTGHRDDVWALALSPDGALVASGSLDRTVQVWGRLGGHQYSLYDTHEAPITCLAWSHAGDLIASGSSGSHAAPASVRLWEVASGQTVGHAAQQSPVFGLAFSPDDATLATGALAGQVCVYALEQPSERSAR